MHPRLLFSEEDEVRKKKTLVLVVAFLLIPALLGLYAVTGPQGGLVAGITPTALPSPGAVATTTPLLPTLTVTATPSAGVTLVAEASATPLSTPTPVPPRPTATPTVTAVPVTIGPTPAPTALPIAPLAAPVITTPPDGSVLKDDRPTISGTAPANTTVQVYDDGTPVGTATADPQGDWALVVDEPLEPGEHTITAVSSDDAGRASAPSTAVKFAVVIERLPVAGGSWFERCLDRLFTALPELK